MNQRSLLTAAAAAVGLLIAAYLAYWWIMADRLATAIDQWVAAEQQSGLTIDYEPHGIGGFPFRFRTTFGRPHVSGTISGQKVEWQGPDVEARLWPFDLESIHLSGSGRHLLDVDARRTVIDGEGLEAEARFSQSGRFTDATLQGDSLTVILPSSRVISLQSGKATLIVPSTPPKSYRDVLLHFSLTAKTLTLPQDLQLLTTDPVQDFSADAQVKGAVPVAPLRQALSAWRDQGGIVEMPSFTASQGPLTVSGATTIALDANLQPIIAANLKAKGMGPTIDLLASQRRIAPNDVLKLKLFIAATEQNAPDGGKQVTSGLTIQNGYLYLGPFKIARVARIDWP